MNVNVVVKVDIYGGPCKGKLSLIVDTLSVSSFQQIYPVTVSLRIGVETVSTLGTVCMYNFGLH